jgi:iron(III) transport system substrate-binding protein
MKMSFGGVLLAALVVALLVGCGGGTPEPAAPEGETAEESPLNDASTEELFEQAKEEGEVVVYSFTSRIAEVEPEFEKEYPGVDLVGNDIDSTEQIARIKSEQQAGNVNADVAYLADAPVVIEELVGPGYLQRYVPPRLAESVPAEFQEPLLSQRLSTKVLMYNEEANPDGPPVENLWELTEEEWRGKVVSVDPQVRGDYLDLMTEIVLRSDEMEAAYEEHFGEPIRLDDGVNSAGEQWVRDFYANRPVFVDDTDNVNAAVGEKGQERPPVGFTSYSDIRDNEEEDWALQVAAGTEPAPGIAFPVYLGVVKDAPHPAGARLFIDFVMGDDSPDGGPGYAPFYVPGDYATRTDVEPNPDALSLEEVGAWMIDPAEVAERRQEVGDLLLTLE